MNRSFIKTRSKLMDHEGQTATLLQITSLIRNGYSVSVKDDAGRDVTHMVLRECAAAHSAADPAILLALIRY